LTLNTLDIILIVVALLFGVIAIVLYFRNRNIAQKSARRTENRMKQQIRIYKDAYDRQNALYEHLKNTKQEEKQTQISTQVNVDAATILLEQKKLEQEKIEFSEKNKRLWSMSIQMQKEKEHINILKNEIERKHRAVTDSIKYAQRIQLAVLPPTEILKNAFADYFLFWRPREIVSGDFYWMKRCGNIIAFTIADCTGHGVPGSFMSLLGVTFLNEVCSNITEKSSPSEILENLRGFIINALSQHQSEDEPKDGMDMAFCLLNLDTLELKFSGANNPLYIVRNGELTEYKGIKNPIGQHPRPKTFETVTIQAQKGDYLYMFSDGFADQFSGTTKRKVTYGRLKELLTELCKQNTSGAYQKQQLSDFIDKWKGGYVQMDDILIGGFLI